MHEIPGTHITLCLLCIHRTNVNGQGITGGCLIPLGGGQLMHRLGTDDPGQRCIPHQHLSADHNKGIHASYCPESQAAVRTDTSDDHTNLVPMGGKHQRFLRALSSLAQHQQIPKGIHSACAEIANGLLNIGTHILFIAGSATQAAQSL